MPAKTALYLRQSIYLPEGIDRQRVRCTALARARGWRVAQVYEDNDTSAFKARGPATQWHQMLEAARRGEFEYVIAVDLDRLLRSITDLAAIIDAGAKMVTVDGEIDLSTADGELRATMLAALARFEVKRKSERISRSHQHRVAQGFPVPGGHRRFGFESDHTLQRADEAEWVRWIYDRFIAGAALHQIVRELNAAGVTTTVGSRWRSAYIRAVLVHPGNIGEVIYRGRRYPSDKVQGSVDPAMFELAQSILRDPSRRSLEPNARRNALLGGLATCGTCNEPLRSCSGKHGYEHVKTYGCMNRGNPLGLRHPMVSRSVLDGMVREAVIDAFSKGHVASLGIRLAPALRKVNRELGDLGARRAHLVSFVSSDRHLRTVDVKAELNSLTRRIDEATERKVRLTAEAFHPRLTESLPRDSDSRRAAIGERFDELDLDSKRALIRDLLEITVRTGVGTGRIEIRHRRRPPRQRPAEPLDVL